MISSPSFLQQFLRLSERISVVPVVVFVEFLDDALFLQQAQDGAVLLVGAVADVQRVRLAQVHAVLDELSQRLTQRRQVALQDSGRGPVLRLQLGRHDAFTAVKSPAENTQRSTFIM